MRKFITLFITFILFCSCVLPVLAAEGDKYKLSFNTNGIQKIEDQWYKENENIKLPAGKADGYMFIGWYANQDFTELFTLDTMPSEDTVVYGLYAVPLSKFVYKFDDINTVIKNAGLTPKEFNELAKKNGFEIAYTVNGSHYAVKDVANYISEITETVNKDIGKGKTAGMNVTIKSGKEDIGTVYAFNIYNDMVADKTIPITTIQETGNTQTTEPAPDGGSSKTIPVLIIFFILTVIITTVIKKAKKDRFKNGVSKFNAVNKKSRVTIKKRYRNINRRIKK